MNFLLCVDMDFLMWTEIYEKSWSPSLSPSNKDLREEFAFSHSAAIEEIARCR